MAQEWIDILALVDPGLFFHNEGGSGPQTAGANPSTFNMLSTSAYEGLGLLGTDIQALVAVGGVIIDVDITGTVGLDGAATGNAFLAFGITGATDVLPLVSGGTTAPLQLGPGVTINATPIGSAAAIIVAVSVSATRNITCEFTQFLVLVETPDPPEELVIDVPDTLDIVLDEEKYYHLTVAGSPDTLYVSTSEGTGDISLRLNFGEIPVGGLQTGTWDYVDDEVGIDKVLTVPSPADGDWYVGILGYGDSTGIVVRAAYDAGGGECFWTDLVGAVQDCDGTPVGPVDGWVDLLTAAELRNYSEDAVIELPYTSSDPDIVRAIYVLPVGATITRWRAQGSFSTTDAAVTGLVGLSIPDNDVVYSEEIASPGTTPLALVDTALVGPISQSVYAQVEIGFQLYTSDGPSFTNCVYDITQLDVYIEYGI